jgi:hypothetical protein
MNVRQQIQISMFKATIDALQEKKERALSAYVKGDIAYWEYELIASDATFTIKTFERFVKVIEENPKIMMLGIRHLNHFFGVSAN